MAEQAIQSDEILDPKVFLTATKNAQALIPELDKMILQFEKLINLNSKGLTDLNVTDSKSLLEHNKLIKESSDLTIKNEAIKKAKLQTELALLKVQIEQDRVAKSKITTEAALQRVLNAQEKQLSKNVTEAEKLTSAYSKVSKKLADTRKEYRDLAIQKQLNLQLTEKEEIRLATLEKRVSTYNNALVAVDQKMGQHTRNVGNYKSAFDGLGNSVNQLTRELPAFAVSAQTGFLAISNNLPIFFDQLQKINAENKILIEQGKKTQSVLGQLAGAVFSFGTILSLGVTLLTLYGKEVIEWVAALFEGEKALESITKAHEEHNKVVNKTKDDIVDLTIQLKVQAGILTKQEGNLLKNENARTKALTANKELRKNDIERLKEELKITDELLGKYGKTKTVITQGGEAREVDLLTAAEKKNVEQFKEGISKINNLQRTRNDYTNEYYNLQGKLVKQDNGDGKFRQKLAREELIIKKNLYDQIRQQEINNIKDEEERELQQAAFNTEKAKRALEEEQELAKEKLRILEDNYKKESALENANTKDTDQKRENLAKLKGDYDRERKQLEASVATTEEYNDLEILLEEELQIKIEEIKDKYSERAENKQVENNAKTKSAQEEVRKDLANFEISELEREYKEKEKKLEAFNLRQINNLEREISAKRAVEIQAEADEKKRLTDNVAEKEAIQTEANIAIEKETQRSADAIAANRQKAFSQAMQFEQQLVDAIAKAEAEKNRLRQDSFNKQISDSEKNIDTQRKLAEKGLKNTLAEEEARKAQLERQKEDDKAKEIKRQKAIAFFKAFSGYMEKGDEAIVALGKASAATYAADAIVGAFIDGTEGNKTLGQMLGKTNTTDGHLILADDNERIFKPEHTAKLGGLTNEEVADLAFKARMGFIDTVKYTAIPTGDFGRNIVDSLLINKVGELSKQMKEMTQAIKDKPVPSWEFNKYGDYIEKRIEGEVIKRTTHKAGRRLG